MLRTIKNLGPPVLFAALLPPGTLVPAVHAQEEKPQCPKPSDVYNQPAPPKCSKEKDESTELERCINSCRQEIQPIKQNIQEGVTSISSFIRDTSTTIGANIDYLRSAPQEVKAGAIGVGALVGSLLGIRRGLFRKLWYGTLAGLGTTAIIYPQESKVVAQEGVQLAKCYGTIAYNFIIGPCKENEVKGGSSKCKPKDS